MGNGLLRFLEKLIKGLESPIQDHGVLSITFFRIRLSKLSSEDHLKGIYKRIKEPPADHLEVKLFDLQGGILLVGFARYGEDIRTPTAEWRIAEIGQISTLQAWIRQSPGEMLGSPALLT